MFEMTKDISVRVKTGVVLIIGMLILGYIDSYFLFWLVFGIMLMISVHESKELYKLNSDSIYIYTLLLWVAVYFYPMPIDLIFIVAIGYASQLAYKRTLDKKLFLPLLYPTASFIFLMTLYSEYGVKVLLWLFVIVAATDIGAYFVGRSFGKTKFCETSPNKTLEGVFGGMAFAIILGTLTSISEVGIIGAIIVSAIVSLSSVFGDLYESYLKREAGVKDSGTILPGHGGVLDRVDGYLFGAITMVVLLRVII
ncbi:phosphatidate cytidylyltransferase [Aliarcobacter butzleri]|uniref:Phosphatidate cytidylyltransferase n=2 Tax=Aliarcobacter butzleri TaxID=28197 RepID=A0AAP4PY41_9BACT|nr:phosphatidate cytidylyltransferase [Aliarcobacter butzleri]KLE11455.1 CDP-diglyceride synthetase [Aliarcobacter butzleri L355]MCG3662983.1 phosphatidate cytidylyltransferase [Aliarcobacter butzleri]MCG3664839.1 phosphatidate cytidylyltransferase [Aliarcobacter butzleri]MCG3676532.1 phosphatidate cytidylyltransferase [Aliarcobacter butzleri]MCG3678762.1 phosphatidate cytidylyltransferase [Aliarcobacter butzleri]